jgi:hypothetical protein
MPALEVPTAYFRWLPSQMTEIAPLLVAGGSGGVTC